MKNRSIKALKTTRKSSFFFFNLFLEIRTSTPLPEYKMATEMFSQHQGGVSTLMQCLDNSSQAVKKHELLG